jgi:hypothetical protein
LGGETKSVFCEASSTLASTIWGEDTSCDTPLISEVEDEPLFPGASETSFEGGMQFIPNVWTDSSRNAGFWSRSLDDNNVNGTLIESAGRIRSITVNTSWNELAISFQGPSVQFSDLDGLELSCTDENLVGSVPLNGGFNRTLRNNYHTEDTLLIYGGLGSTLNDLRTIMEGTDIVTCTIS